jgi:hypothetical protein
MMAQKRIIISNTTAAYHIICRTACQAYLLQEREREVFVKMMMQQARFAGIEVLAYCVMSNHVHLLARVSPIDTLPDRELLKRYLDYYGKEKVPQSTYSPEELEALLSAGGPDADAARERILSRMGDLSAFMRELKQRFTIWYNHEHDNHGTIWAARFKSLIVENTSECLTKVAAYIDLNPVRAKMVESPDDYRWCGYAAALAGLAAQKQGLLGLFFYESTFEEVLADYRLILFGKGYTSKGTVNKDLGTISPEKLETIIQNKGKLSPNQLLRMRIRYFADGTAIGSKAFVDEIFNHHREAFGPKRKNGGKPLPAGLWGNLHVMRDLKTNVYE